MKNTTFRHKEAGKIFTFYEIRELRVPEKTGSQKTSKEQEAISDNTQEGKRISILFPTLSLPSNSVAVQRILKKEIRTLPNTIHKNKLKMD